MTRKQEDLISRDAALDACSQSINILDAMSRIEDLPSVTPKQRKGHCKDCKYCLKKGDRAPLILPNEICSRWGGGCKTKEDGYCFLFEPQESEG